MNPSFIVIHHSLTEDGKTVSWQAIRQYHIETLNYKDISYHYGIELVNNHYEILKGRMDNEAGAHCLGFNDKSIGICLVGNYDIAPPAYAQLIILAKLVHSLMEIYGIPHDQVIGHWESYGLLGKPVEKSCPGVKFSMTDFRKMI